MAIGHWLLAMVIGHWLSAMCIDYWLSAMCIDYLPLAIVHRLWLLAIDIYTKKMWLWL